MWCSEQSRITEVLQSDRTRCDCLTQTHVIEFECGPKWAESLGQSLYYSIQTGKKAEIVLILEKPSEYKYWRRISTVITYNNLKIDPLQITLWGLKMTTNKIVDT